MIRKPRKDKDHRVPAVRRFPIEKVQANRPRAIQQQCSELVVVSIGTIQLSEYCPIFYVGLARCIAFCIEQWKEPKHARGQNGKPHDFKKFPFSAPPELSTP